jgi:hypothetical protein
MIRLLSKAWATKTILDHLNGKPSIAERLSVKHTWSAEELANLEGMLADWEYDDPLDLNEASLEAWVQHWEQADDISALKTTVQLWAEDQAFWWEYDQQKAHEPIPLGL